MTASITFELVHEITTQFGTTNSIGVYVLDNNTLLAGLAELTVSAQKMHFLRSTDDGDTWTELSTLDFSQNSRGTRLAKLPGGKLFYCTEAPDFYDFHIHRSLDGGESWSEVWTFTGDPSFIKATGIACSALTWDRANVLLSGRVPDDHGNLVASYCTSTDGGATWTLGPNLQPPPTRPTAWTAAAAPNGLWILGHARKNIFKTTNHGFNWLNLGPLPEPAPSTDVVFFAADWITNQILLAGGLGAGGGWNNKPALWRSPDAGQTWTRLTAADVAEFVSTSFTPGFQEIKRLTRDTVLLGMLIDSSTSQSPIRMSIDAGQTFPIIAGGFSYVPDTELNAGGAISTSSTGKIFTTVDYENPAAARAQIWRGTYTC